MTKIEALTVLNNETNAILKLFADGLITESTCHACMNAAYAIYEIRTGKREAFEEFVG